jgi:hypothetical protein
MVLRRLSSGKSGWNHHGPLEHTARLDCFSSPSIIVLRAFSALQV